MHRPLRVVFMRLGPAKIHQQSVTEVLGNMPLVALDDLGTGLLIGAQDSTKVFGVELARQDGGVGQVAKHYRQLAPFGVRLIGHGRRGYDVSALALWSCTCCPEWRGSECLATRPDEHGPFLINCEPLAADDFRLQILRAHHHQDETVV